MSPDNDARPLATITPMKTTRALTLLTILWCLAPGCVAPRSRAIRPLPANAIRPRVAVSSFDNRSGFSGQWHIGPGMADLMVSELVASRNFVVLERQGIDTVVDEIVRQRNEFFRKEGRVQAGRLANAQYLVRGVITDFTQSSGGSLWLRFRRFLVGGSAYTARVGLALTIVDVETGRIVDSVTSAGRASAKSAFAQGSYKGVHFGGDGFFKTPLGIATADAIREGLRGIVKKVPRQYWSPMIADIRGGHIVLNGGGNRGLRQGQSYLVRQAGRPVTDPSTGEALDVLPGAVVGVVQVTHVGDKLSYAEPLQGQGFARGQHLQKVSKSTLERMRRATRDRQRERQP